VIESFRLSKAMRNSHEESAPMTELIVIGFKGELRACQVITEVRLLHREASDMVDHAIVVTRDMKGRVRVHRTVDPTSHGEATWAGLWNALISAALLLPLAEEAPTPTSHNNAACQTNGVRSAGPTVPYPDARWWVETISLPCDFVADIGAILQQDCSAILMLTGTAGSSAVVQQLRRSGGTFLRHTLAQEQEARLSAAFGDRQRLYEMDGRRAQS
jgi:uncharacterized membrane protein